MNHGDKKVKKRLKSLFMFHCLLGPEALVHEHNCVDDDLRREVEDSDEPYEDKEVENPSDISCLLRNGSFTTHVEYEVTGGICNWQ